MDNVTPLHKDRPVGDVVKQQMLDSLAQHYDNHSEDLGNKPVTCFVVMVDEFGGAGSSWLVDTEHEKHTALYIARALFMAQYDAQAYQRCADEGNHP